MKKFTDSGVCFVLSSYRITAAPFAAEDEDTGIRLAHTICSDACYLSSNGTGQSAIELLRIDGGSHGKEIEHYLTVRTYDTSEKLCVMRQDALTGGIVSALHIAGYAAEEVSYDKYRRSVMNSNTENVWALRKQDVQEYGIQKSYRTPPVVSSVDWKLIYSSLTGSGCSIYIQIIPSQLSKEEHSVVMKRTAECSQAVDGVIPNLRDSLATSAAERWKYFAERQNLPFAEVNIAVCGERSKAAIVAARVKQAVDMQSFSLIPIEDFNMITTYNQPWQMSSRLKRNNAAILSKWTAEEVSHIFQMPCQRDYFIGLKGNAFSLIPETELLPTMASEGGTNRMMVGTTIFSQRDIYIPYDQLLLHTAIIGKTGSGKTTLLKQFIADFDKSGIPVTIFEPVKAEYRSLLGTMKNSRIFTVENPTVPLLINPFRVPRGVTLGEYRSHLLSAFKAAFSLPDPLPSLFEKAISDSYSYYGWSDMSKSSDEDVTAFDMSDFIRIFKGIINSSSYSAEVKGNMMSGGAFRLQSLIERCPHTFNTINSTDVEDLISGRVVLEMGNLEPEQKSLVSAIVMISILAYLKATRRGNNKLRNIILIDEAHALLDQGNGTTEEEKSLNDTMTQLMINIITEIRAYGVGVIFSDQSPSRMGSCILDNVDNLISFRLSGLEAELVKTHIGLDEDACKVLPLLSAGEMVIKNHLIHEPLAVRMRFDNKLSELKELSDIQIAEQSRDYLISNISKYIPYAMCEITGCKRCSYAVRNKANNLAVHIFSEQGKSMKTANGIAGIIVSLPDRVIKTMPGITGTEIRMISSCTAVQLLNKCKMEYGISIGKTAVSKLLEDMMNTAIHRKGGR